MDEKKQNISGFNTMNQKLDIMHYPIFWSTHNNYQQQIIRTIDTDIEECIYE